jgi:hypothetical protein
MGRVKERYVWCPERRELVEVPVSYTQAAPGVIVMPDTPDYVSPVTGLVVHGRRGRREDLKRTGSRPYEGREQEVKHAKRVAAEQESRADARRIESIREVFQQLPPSKRRELEGR